MRRTFLFAFVLLVLSATSAFASAAGSTQARRKASAHAHRTSSPSSTAMIKHAHVRTPPSAAKRSVRYTPERTTTVATPSTAGANAAYSVGYQTRYDASRATLLNELQSQ